MMLLPEEWGGQDDICANFSKIGAGIDQLS